MKVGQMSYLLLPGAKRQKKLRTLSFWSETAGALWLTIDCPEDPEGVTAVLREAETLPSVSSNSQVVRHVGSMISLLEPRLLADTPYELELVHVGARPVACYVTPYMIAGVELDQRSAPVRLLDSQSAQGVLLPWEGFNDQTFSVVMTETANFVVEVRPDVPDQHLEVALATARDQLLFSAPARLEVVAAPPGDYRIHVRPSMDVAGWPAATTEQRAGATDALGDDRPRPPAVPAQQLPSGLAEQLANPPPTLSEPPLEFGNGSEPPPSVPAASNERTHTSSRDTEIGAKQAPPPPLDASTRPFAAPMTFTVSLTRHNTASPPPITLSPQGWQHVTLVAGKADEERFIGQVKVHRSTRLEFSVRTERPDRLSLRYSAPDEAFGSLDGLALRVDPVRRFGWHQLEVSLKGPVQAGERVSFDVRALVERHCKPVEGEIFDVRDDLLTVNLSRWKGLHVGLKAELLSEGQPVARVEVVEVFARSSLVRIVEAHDFRAQVGMIVRFPCPD